MIDILYLVYPNMVGLMSQLSAVRFGEYPFFENAMSREHSSPIWGVLTDEGTIDGWLEGLRGKGSRLYISVPVSEPDDKPKWCDGMDWRDCVLNLITKADNVLMIEQSKNNYLYDQILLGATTPGSRYAMVGTWVEMNEFYNDVESSGDIKERIDIETLRNKNSIEMLYRHLGVRLLTQRHVSRNDKVVGEKVQEALKGYETYYSKGKKRSGPIPKKDLVPFAERFSICISAHPAYLKMIPGLLDEWDRQIGDLPIKKVILYDHDIVPEFKDGWEVIFPVRAYGQPCPLRNKALEIDVDWIQYWDCDNTPSEDHFDTVFKKAYWAKQDVGILFHEIIGIEGVKLSIPEGNDPRKGYFIDTASCWRKEAILSAGGWQVGRTEEDMAIKGVADWALARDIRLAGWKLENTGVVLEWQNTEGNITSQYDDIQFKWASREFAIIILFRGDDEFLERVKADLQELILPPHCSITIVCDSDDGFYRKVFEWLIYNPKNERFERKTIFRAREQNCPINSGNEFMKIHAHVADMYSRAIRATPEELILFWEDDVRPEPEALRALSDQLCSSELRDIACVGAPYLVRENTYMAAARKKDYWEDPLLMSEITEEPMEVGMLAGGFTLYDRVALEQCPMLGPLNIMNKNGFLGWDGFLCKRMNEAGWKIQLCGKSKVEHLPK